MSHSTYEWDMSEVWLSHIYASHQAYALFKYISTYANMKPVVSHIRISHSTHMNESCHIYAWVMSQRVSKFTKCVMSHVWISHGTHANVTEGVRFHVMCNVNKTWHTSMSHVTHMNAFTQGVKIHKMCNVTRMNTSWHTCEYHRGCQYSSHVYFHTNEQLMAHIWMCQVMVLVQNCCLFQTIASPGPSPKV